MFPRHETQQEHAVAAAPATAAASAPTLEAAKIEDLFREATKGSETRSHMGGFRWQHFRGKCQGHQIIHF